MSAGDPGLVPLTPVVAAYRIEGDAGGGYSTVSQLAFTVFKWKGLIVGLCLIFGAAAVIAMVIKPTVREATAKVILKGDRIPLQISGLVGSSSRLPHSPQLLQSEVEMVKSHEVLLPVARVVLERGLPAGQSPEPAALAATAAALAARTVAVAIPETNVIQITHAATTSEEAERTLRLIVAQYMEQHALANSGSRKLLAFYEQEAGRVGDALRSAEERLRAWHRAQNIVSVDAEITAMLTTLADRQRALRQTDADLQAAAAGLATVERQRSGLPARLVTSADRVPNPLVSKLQLDVAEAQAALHEVDRSPLVTSLKGDIVGGEVALQELLQRYTDGDRRVQEKREQIGFLRTELASATERAEATAGARLALLKRELAAAEATGAIVGRETTALHPLREALDKDASAARAVTDSLGAQQTALRGQIGELATAVTALREKKLEVDRRGRDVEMRREAFLLYGRKLEEARIAAGLEREQLATIAVIEQPHALPGTDMGRRLIMVALAAAVGLALGATVAFGIELLNDSIRTEADVERYLGAPVLAAIPDSRARPLALTPADTKVTWS